MIFDPTFVFKSEDRLKYEVCFYKCLGKSFMASYKNPQKNTKMKGKFYSDTSTRKSSEKPKKEKSPTLLTKVVVRRLPPSMTEDMFKESVSPLPEYDYFAFINADSSLGSSAYSRAYINFKNMEDVYTFYDKFDGYVFVDQKGNEHPAMVEYAPFQKIPKRSGGKKKDARCGTIDEDVDYLTFLESLTKPVTITLPPLEAVLEEIQAHDRELKANNGLIKVKTPLLEYIEQRKAEKLRSKEEKKEERRRKELERKKAREEERKKKKEIREHHKEMKKEQQKDDSSVKVLRPERSKDDYVSEGRQERSKADRDKERQKREEERLKLRKEKEKLRREREKEERLRRLEDKAKHREEEKSKHKDEVLEEMQEEKVLTSKPEGSKSKRYSEGRRKEREKDKIKEERDKEKKSKEEQDDVEMETVEENKAVEKSTEKEENETSKKEEKSEETEKVPSTSRKRREKDPRVERRIRNKDRPAMALYRPGQSRLSSRMRQDREEGVETSSSSPSPVMPAGDQKKLPPLKRENTDSSRSDCKEESSKTKSVTEDLVERKSVTEGSQDDRSSGGECCGGKDVDIIKNSNDEENDGDLSGSIEGKDKDSKIAESHEDADEAHSSTDSMHNKTEDSVGSKSKDVKKYPGVKSMTFRRSVSRE